MTMTLSKGVWPEGLLHLYEVIRYTLLRDVRTIIPYPPVISLSFVGVGYWSSDPTPFENISDFTGSEEFHWPGFSDFTGALRCDWLRFRIPQLPLCFDWLIF